jgi:hypothetical protein
VQFATFGGEVKMAIKRFIGKGSRIYLNLNMMEDLASGLLVPSMRHCLPNRFGGCTLIPTLSLQDVLRLDTTLKLIYFRPLLGIGTAIYGEVSIALNGLLKKGDAGRWATDNLLIFGKTNGYLIKMVSRF